MAGTAWNAGFSRHSPPQAGGGTDLIRGDGSVERADLRGVATNRPRPCGPLCRLKPAFQAGGVITAAGRPARAADYRGFAVRGSEGRLSFGGSAPSTAVTA